VPRHHVGLGGCVMANRYFYKGHHIVPVMNDDIENVVDYWDIIECSCDASGFDCDCWWNESAPTETAASLKDAKSIASKRWEEGRFFRAVWKVVAR